MSDHRRKAELALAEGDLAAFRSLFAEAPPPSDDADRAAWCILLVEAGELESARELLATIAEVETRGALEALLEPEPITPPGEEDAEDEALDELELRPHADGPADAEVVRLFIRWFAGRGDLYATQWYDERRRRGGYRPVREPLTEDVVRAHLAGRRTVGQYLLWPDESVSFAVFDLDLGGSARAELEAARGPGSLLRHRDLRAHAARLIEAGRRLGIPLFAEDSGGRGIHLWCFFEPRRSARAARALLSRIADGAGSLPADVSLEIFPKQERAGQRGLSSLIKLPLGLHRATLRRCPLLDEKLEPIDDARAALTRLRVAEPSRIDDVLGHRVMALPLTSTHDERAPALPTESSPRSMARALRDVPDGKEARLAAERMIENCGVLRALVDRAHGAASLTPDEARALVYSIGLVGKTPTLATEILAAARVPMRELHRVRRGLPSPVGCRRLLALGVARCEACPTGPNAQPYATPASFAVGAHRPSPPRHDRFAAWLEPADHLAADALESLTARMEALERRLKEVEGEHEDEA